MEIILFESAEAFERWLDEHHSSSPGIWLKLRKKAPGVVAPEYAQALDVALCYGWIDGQKGGFDGSYWLQRFTPRKPRSSADIWSGSSTGTGFARTRILTTLERRPVLRATCSRNGR